MGANVVLHLTEWKQFRNIDLAKLAVVVANLSIIDGRNIFDPDQWRPAGWACRALGRPTI
jgi:UDPglucose 6-dehydrogenase